MATVRFLGAAQDIQQVDTYEFINTWAAGDTVSWEINNKTLTLTVDGSDKDEIAQQAKAMFLAKKPTEGVRATETRNFGGQQIPEFTELDTLGVSVSGSILTLKWTAGVPVTIASSVNTADSGDVTHVAVTAATGKNFGDNGDNWEGGSVPTEDDILLFDQGSVDLKYNMDFSGGTKDDMFLWRRSGYKGNIGLPAINPLGYVEYRNRYLVIPSDGGTTGGCQLGDLGEDANPVGFTYIDFGTTTATTLTCNIFDAPPFDPNTGYPVQLVQGDGMSLTCYSGGVRVGGDSSLSPSQLVSVSVNDSATVMLDENVSLKANSAITQTGGNLLCLSTSAGSNNPTYVIHGGSSVFLGPNLLSMAIHTGASVTYEGATCTTCNLYSGGSLAEGAKIAATITNMNIYRESTLVHPRDKFTFTNGIDFQGCRPSEVNWTAPLHKTWTPSAIS